MNACVVWIFLKPTLEHYATDLVQFRPDQGPHQIQNSRLHLFLTLCIPLPVSSFSRYCPTTTTSSVLKKEGLLPSLLSSPTSPWKTRGKPRVTRPSQVSMELAWGVTRREASKSEKNGLKTRQSYVIAIDKWKVKKSGLTIEMVYYGTVQAEKSPIDLGVLN